MIERILILSPHTDDGELSAGGTISRFINEKKEIFYIAFSSCEKSVPECHPKNILKTECMEATEELGIPADNVILLNYQVREFQKFRHEILNEMISIGKELSPDLIITPSSFDTHQDHQVINNEAIRAFKKTSSIWGMEHPWNNLIFRTDIFMELEEKFIEKKINALKRYNSQSFRDYFNEEYIKACAYTRGMNIGVKYAEVFECIRLQVRR